MNRFKPFIFHIIDCHDIFLGLHCHLVSIKGTAVEKTTPTLNELVK